jgi:hypothetical protein
VIECICGDGTTIPPLVIFKGQNLQTAWIPKDMTTSWKFTCNTKGWTSDKIGEEWFTQCFEPATSAKANGKKRLLVCDGHGSHVSATMIAFCIQHNIELLLMPPHSSHLCQPLDVGVFSSLKRAMTNEMDKIMRYGVPTIKKFEWADAYRLARPKAFSESNIKSGWSGTGLIPFNRRRVIGRLADTMSPEPDSTSSPPSSASEIPSCPFLSVPDTPSKLDSASLRVANTTLLQTMDASNLDTPTKRYISRLASLTENLRARCMASELQFEEISKIVKQRREYSSGKRVALKDQIVLTMPEIYAKINSAENATRQKRRKVARNSDPEARDDSEDHVEDQIGFNEDADAFGIEDRRELEW